MRHFSKIKNNSNKNVFITGGSKGLGKALAQKFLSLGSNVTIVARNQKELAEAVTELEKFKINPNQKLFSVSADVTNWNSISECMKTSVDKVGVPDVVIPNAGISKCGLFNDLTIEDIEQENRLNYLGTIFTIKAALPYLIQHKQNSAHIVIVSSAAAFSGFIGYSAYSATKQAIKGIEREDIQVYES